MKKFIFHTVVKKSKDEVFGWYQRAGFLERSIPPWEQASNLTTLKNVQIERKDSNTSILIKQVKDSFTYWEHEVTLIEKEGHSCEIVDQFRLSYKFPWLGKFFIKKRLSNYVAYKNEIIFHDISTFSKYKYAKPLRILLSGSHGLIGRALFTFLHFAGHDVWRMSKDQKESLSEYENFDVIIHLAGENIAKGRWSKMKKEKILRSRVDGTRNVAQIISKLKNPPKVFLCASAIGIYGDRNNEVLLESDQKRGDLFISKVCEEWESAAKSIILPKLRIVNLRFGMVLSSAGGALKEMLFPFRLGFGGKLGKGDQFISWICIDDVIGAIYHLIMTPSLEGAVNITSPYPVTNAEFTKELAKCLHRCIGPPLPKCVILFLFGQKGKELLISSTRAAPSKLLQTEYTFQYPCLKDALIHVISR